MIATAGSRDAAQIVNLYRARKNARGPEIARAQQVRDAYNGDVAVPLPELDKTEKVACANLMFVGLDQTAMRVASVSPDVYFPPTDPGTRRAERNARISRRATLGWMEANRLGLIMRKRSRWLIGYASAPVVIRPDQKRGIPRWEPRDPLSCYPAPVTSPAEVRPDDCLFAFVRTYAWLCARYPDAMELLDTGPDPAPDDTYECLEYVDGEQLSLLVLARAPGQSNLWTPSVSTTQGDPFAVLESVPNRAGTCTAVVPGRVTLDRPQGQFDGLIGLFQLQSKIQALEVIALQRNVFPQQWLIGKEGQTPKIITMARPEEGTVGKAVASTMEVITPQPNLQGMNMVNYLERAQRVQGLIPADFGGESATNVRTGRRGDAILSATVDHTIAEAHDIFAASVSEEVAVAVATAKAYFGNSRRSFYVSLKGARGQADYIPNKNFDTDRCVVSYAQAGADVNSLVIGGGQRVAMKTMSRRSFMEIDPLVTDPEIEHDRITGEALEDAALQTLLAQAQQGAVPLSDLARIMEIVVTDKKELTEAIVQAHQEAQQRQATPPETPAEAAPGLAQPGAGAEAGASIPPPTPSMDNLGMLLGSLGRTQGALSRTPTPALARPG